MGKLPNLFDQFDLMQTNDNSNYLRKSKAEKMIEGG